jgi:ADP-ribose pyrophosphatase YjhB (NUDIX family)
MVCEDCDFIRYDNPKIIAGVVPIYQDKVLLCTRAIAPQIGFWTVPAGFLELGESPAEGAARESLEEATAVIEVGDLIGVYTIRHIGQVQMFFRGTMSAPEHAAGEESLETKLFGWDEIPWDELAFPTIRWALRDYQRNTGNAQATPGSRVVG